MTVAVAVAAAATSTGNQDITTSDLGGNTPKAAILLYARGGSDGTITADSGMSFGVTDGTAGMAFAFLARDGMTSSSNAVGRVSKSDKVLTAIKYDGGFTTHSEAEFVSFITNGIRINWTTADATAEWLVTALFFEGSDWTVDCGNETLDVDPVTVTTGFQPDAVLLFSVSDDMTGTIQTTRAKHTIGITTWRSSGIKEKVEQNSFAWGVTRQSVIQNTDQFSAQSFDVGVGGTYDIDVDRAATGFMAEVSGLSIPDASKWGYLALKYDGSGELSCGTIELDDSTGDQAFNIGAEAAQFVLLLMAQNTGDQAFDRRFGVSFNTESKTGGIATAGLTDANLINASNPTSMDSVAMDDSLTMLAQTGTKNIEGTFVSLDSVGFTLNFTNAPSFGDHTGVQFNGIDWHYFTIINPAAASTARVQAWIID